MTPRLDLLIRALAGACCGAGGTFALLSLFLFQGRWVWAGVPIGLALLTFGVAVTIYERSHTDVG